MLRPRSSGTVRLRGRDPTLPPMIVPGYFTDPQDLKVLVEGIKIAVNISQTPAFQRFNSRLHPIPLPGCRKHPFATDEYWECAIRQFTFTIYHPTGTCRMGPESDPRTVVNPRLKVRDLIIKDIS